MLLKAEEDPHSVFPLCAFQTCVWLEDAVFLLAATTKSPHSPQEGGSPTHEGVKEGVQPVTLISFFDSWEADFHFPKEHAELAWEPHPA